MSIRAKLLLALLLAALIPLVFAAAAGYQSTVRLGRRVASDQREALLRDAEGVLSGLMRKNISLLEQEAQVYFATNRVLAREVERLLAGPAPEGAEVRGPAAFREGGSAPGLAESGQHVRAGPGGEPSPSLVSFQTPAFYIAPDGSDGDAAKLAGVGVTLRTMRPALSRSVYWQFVTLESGVHMVYPGHGLLPDGYDARTSAVYERARNATGAGSPPSIDPATGQTLVGVLHPLVDPSGRRIGFLGLHARADAMVGEFELGAAWGEDAETYFVALERDAAGEPGISIIARRSYAERAVASQGFIGVDQFRADDPADTRAIIDALASAGLGTRIIGLGGEPMLCAYGGLRGDSIGLVTVAPVASVAALAGAAEARVHQAADTQLARVLGGVLALGVLMSFAAWLGARRITRPIASLAGAIRRVSEGDLEVRAAVRGRDEVAVLAGAFNTMVPRLRDQMRMRQSLDLAQQVQRGLLPAEPPRVRGFDVAGVSRYCDETGGDYYDFLGLDQPAPGRLTIAVGDVTGHGVAAALLMATARALIRMRSALPGEMAERLSDINRHLAGDVSPGRFMTLMLLSLERGSGMARWVGAGHDPVIVYDPARDAFSELAGEDIPLGVEAGWRFRECEARVLESGLVLVLGTDGVWEAMNAAGELFGKERLRTCIRDHAAGSARAIADAVLREIAAFLGPEAPGDDVTMVVIKVAAD
ncbi:MAG TPA: SpoIIE family protein phosphatase [Phycisphaerales bacterium]|nr:SpoIIE family protein phosphatase [Phycisphaerales bacterium]